MAVPAAKVPELPKPPPKKRSKENELPVFRRENLLALEMPDDYDMQWALHGGIDAILFKAGYLADDSASTITAHMGGLDGNAEEVAMALRHGANLALIYAALFCNDVEQDDDEPKGKE